MAESGIGLRSIPLLLAFAAGLAEAAGQSNRIENLVQLLGGQVGAFAGTSIWPMQSCSRRVLFDVSLMLPSSCAWVGNASMRG